MPLYEYHCQQCGLFEIILDSNKITNSCACPTCYQHASRVFSNPTFCSVFSGTRHALRKRADQSHEPRIMNEAEKKQVFSSDLGACGHSHHHKPGSKTKQVPDRPWMMKH